MAECGTFKGVSENPMLGGGSEIGGGENVLIECMHHTSFFCDAQSKIKT